MQLKIHQLIPWHFILLIGIAQLLVKYAILIPFLVATTLSTLGFFLLVVATTLIAIGGSAIVPIYKYEKNNLKKEEKWVTNAYRIFFTCSILGVLLGFYICNSIGKSAFFVLFVLFSALYYGYATFLQFIPYISAFLRSLLFILPIFFIIYFELIPATTASNLETQRTFFEILTDYCIFLFLVITIAILVQNIHVKSYSKNIKSITHRKLILLIITILTLGASCYYLITYFYKQPIFIGYTLLFIIAPLLYFCTALFKANSKKEYIILNRWIAFAIVFSVLSLALHPFILKN